MARAPARLGPSVKAVLRNLQISWLTSGSPLLLPGKKIGPSSDLDDGPNRSELRCYAAITGFGRRLGRLG
jgi:hypothetical protein